MRKSKSLTNIYNHAVSAASGATIALISSGAAVPIIATTEMCYLSHGDTSTIVVAGTLFAGAFAVGGVWAGKCVSRATDQFKKVSAAIGCIATAAAIAGVAHHYLSTPAGPPSPEILFPSQP